MSGVGLVILAAGASSRMGRPKQLLRYHGQFLIQHGVQTAMHSAAQPVVVVLGANAEQIQPVIAAHPIHVVINAEWSLGMSTSIRAGIATLNAIDPAADGVIIMTGDQPLITTAILNSLVEQSQATSHRIVASEYAGILGVPAFFHRSVFPELLALTGDVGARYIIQQHLNETLPYPNPNAQIDIDTPAHYQQLLQQVAE